MQELVCEHCGKTVPLNESATVLGQQICFECTENEAKNNPKLSPDDVKPNLDPTICAKCARDGGSLEMEIIMGFPVCAGCAPNFGNHPFPKWIKLGALGLAILVVLSFALNVRFWRANNELEEFWVAMEAGDHKKAALLAESATQRVPEVDDIQYLGYFSAGLVFMEEENPSEALKKFQICKHVLPPEFMVEELIESANRSIAFNDGNYDQFLALAREAYGEDPGNRTNILFLASALACKFAETGEENYKTQSREKIEEYKVTPGPDDNTDYVMRIQHRLYAREVLQPSEFYERYPDGWTNPEGDE